MEMSNKMAGPIVVLVEENSPFDIMIYGNESLLCWKQENGYVGFFFFEKETAPASASIDAYGHLLKLNHNELTNIIHPNT
jgi:hypothetical protein